jgi:hypothetical protein
MEDSTWTVILRNHEDIEVIAAKIIEPDSLGDFYEFEDSNGNIVAKFDKFDFQSAYKKIK